jgi:hypothetical protein
MNMFLLTELISTGLSNTTSLPGASFAEAHQNITNTSEWSGFVPDIPITMPLVGIGVVGNVIVIILVSSRRELHTPTYTAIACLSVADLFCMCSRIVHMMSNMHIVAGNQTWYMYMLAEIRFYTFHSANYHIVLIAYLRYVFIVRPLQSLTVTTKRVLKMSGGVWLAGILAVSLHSTGIILMQQREIIYVGYLYEMIFAIYVTFVPLLLLAVLHVRKIFKLRQRGYLSQEQPSSISRKMSVMLFVLIAIYVVSSLPPLGSVVLQLVCFLIDYRVAECQLFSSRYSVPIVALCLLLNNSVNPVIYFFFSTPCRNVFRRLAQCCRKS